MEVHEGALPFICIDEVPYVPDSPSHLKDWWTNPPRYIRAELNAHWLNAPAPRSSEVWVLDTREPDLALRIRKSGAKTFYLFLESHRSAFPNTEGQEAKRQFLADTANLSIEQVRCYVPLVKRNLEHRKPAPRLRRGQTVEKLIEVFEAENPPNSDWSERRNGFLHDYALPKFGRTVISGVQRSDWLHLAQVVGLTQASRGRDLLKALKGFLGWAAKRGALQVNPLAGAQICLPSPKSARRLDTADLVAIFDAAQCIGSPWDAMFGVMILTGEALTYVGRIQTADIKLGPRVWIVDGAQSSERHCRHIHLTEDVVDLLSPYLGNHRYLFHPKRVTQAPLKPYTELLDQIREQSGVQGGWSVRDCRRAIRAELGSSKPSREALTFWAERFRAAREKAHRDRELARDSVVL